MYLPTKKLYYLLNVYLQLLLAKRNRTLTLQYFGVRYVHMKVWGLLHCLCIFIQYTYTIIENICLLILPSDSY